MSNEEIIARCLCLEHLIARNRRSRTDGVKKELDSQVQCTWPAFKSIARELCEQLGIRPDAKPKS